MNRALSVFLITAALVSVAFVADFDFGSAQSSTEVSGVLTQDTVWSKQGSPYVFTGAVGVPAGVTLTVEAGAVVDLGGYYLQVNGTLNVLGTSTEKVTLTSNANQTNGPPLDGVNTSPIGGNRNIVIAYDNPTCNIDNAVLNNTSIYGASLFSSSAKLTVSNSELLSSGVIIRGSTTITDCYVTGDVNLDGASTITDNILLKGICVTGNLEGVYHTGTFLVSGNNITNPDGLAVNAAGSGVIKNNIIWGSVRGITQEDKTVLSATIQDNLIFNNKYGIYLRDNQDDAVIKDNTFAANQVGIFNPDYSLTITDNNFVENTQYDIQAGSSAVDASGNWWGTTDRSEINQKIYDSNDDFSLGTIVYTPFLTQADASAPQQAEDIMLPTVTASPTDGVTYQTVNHPSTSLSGLEVGGAAAVVVVAVAVAVWAHRKRA